MNQYEVMYVIDTNIDETTRTNLINRMSERVAQNGGKVDRVDEWGKRRLAYPINYKTEGYYVLMYITAPSELPRELERRLKINENVLRYLTVRFEGPIPAKREPLKPYAQREAAAAPAPAAAPVAAPVVAEATEEEAPETEAE